MEEKSVSQMRKELQEFYFTKVRSNLDKINKIRKHEKVNAISAFCMILGIIGLFGINLTSFISEIIVAFLPEELSFIKGIIGVGYPVICIILMFGSLIVLLFNNRQNKSKTVNIDTRGEAIIKKQLMSDFLKIFGNFSWSQGGGSMKDMQYFQNLSKLNIMSSSLIGNIDDSITGVYKDVRFRIFEYDTSLSLQNLMGYLVLAPFAIGCGCAVLLIGCGFLVTIAAVTNFFGILWIIPALLLLGIIAVIFAICTYVPFRGVFVEFDMNKNFEGHTFLYENAPTSRGILYNHAAFENVQLEDVDFCNRYKIFSDNQIEARIVLTPAFIERFKNIKTAFKAKYMRAAFKDKKITIAVNAGKDLFAMANFSKDTNAETFVELFNEILSVLQMIDALKLNQKIGL